MPLELWDQAITTALDEFVPRERRASELCLCCKTFYSVAADSRFNNAEIRVEKTESMILYFESHPLSARRLLAISIPFNTPVKICSRFAKLNLQNLKRFSIYANIAGNQDESSKIWKSIFSSCPALQQIGCCGSAVLGWPLPPSTQNQILGIVLDLGNFKEESRARELSTLIGKNVKGKLDLGLHLGKNLTTSRVTSIEVMIKHFTEIVPDLNVVLAVPKAHAAPGSLQQVASIKQRFSRGSAGIRDTNEVQKYREREFEKMWDLLNTYRTRGKKTSFQDFYNSFLDDDDPLDEYDLQDLGYTHQALEEMHADYMENSFVEYGGEWSD